MLTITFISLVPTMCINAKATPTNKTNLLNQSYGVHIMPLLNGSYTLRGGHTHAHAYRHSQTEAILRNQMCAGHRLGCTWFKIYTQ